MQQKVSWIRQVCFGFITVVAFFALLEGALRLADYPPGASYRPAPGAGWSLQPNLQASPMTHHESGTVFHVSTDENGLRRTPSPPAPPPGCTFYRILLLGDSNTFGWGLEEDQTWAYSLQQAFQDHAVQVINAGMPGYTIVQCLELFRRVGTRYDPDMVILSVGMHDIAPAPSNPPGSGPRAVAVDTRRSLLARSKLARLLRKILVAPPPHVQRPALDTNAHASETTPHPLKPPKVPPGEFEKALNVFCDLGDQAGFQVVTAPIPGINTSSYRAIMRRLAGEGRLHHVALSPSTPYERLPGDPNHLGPRGAARFGRDLAQALAPLVPNPCKAR